MSILVWEKPPRVMSVEAWKSISADSAPPGVYVSNMSTADAERWKATFKGQRSDVRQVEIRKQIRGTQLLVIVGLHGYNYKHYRASPRYRTVGDHRYTFDADTSECQVHLALNGGAMMTLTEFAELQQAVAEAVEVLRTVERLEG